MPFEAHDRLVLCFDPAQLKERLQRPRHGQRHDVVRQARRLDNTLRIIALKRRCNGRKRRQQLLGEPIDLRANDRALVGCRQTP